MPETFSTQYRGAREEMHAWYVYVNNRDLDRPNPAVEVFEFAFNRAYPRWSCTCFSGFQFPGSYICEHARAVFGDITRRKGVWEGDQILMGAAWEALSTNQEKLEVQYGGSRFGSHLWRVSPGEDRSSYYELYIEPQARKWVCTCEPNEERNLNSFACRHVQAVFAMASKRNSAGSWTEDAQFMEMANQFMRDRERSRYAQGGVVSKRFQDNLLVTLSARSSFDNYKTKVFDNYKTKVDEARKAMERYAWAYDSASDKDQSKISGLKANSVTIDEPFTTFGKAASLSIASAKEDFIAALEMLNGDLSENVTKDTQDLKIERPQPKKPEEPKKPKSRFSEIDL